MNARPSTPASLAYEIVAEASITCGVVLVDDKRAELVEKVRTKVDGLAEQERRRYRFAIRLNLAGVGLAAAVSGGHLAVEMLDDAELEHATEVNSACVADLHRIDRLLTLHADDDPAELVEGVEMVLESSQCEDARRRQRNL